MATFETQVEGLTGIAIDGSSSPTQDELTEYLKDGVNDVTNRIITLKPQDASLFTRKSASDTQGVGVGRSQIISVLREANADGSTDGSTAWRSCRQVPIDLQSRVVDSDSLHFASIYNPVYVLDDTGIVNVYPTPSSNNGIEVYYINNTPVNGSGSSLVYSHDDIKYFPSNKIYLVMIYASIKSLENAMSAKSLPGVSGDATELTSVSPLASDNTIDVLGDQDEYDQWWSTFGHLLEGEEDTELAAVQIQKLTTYINAWAAQLQGVTTEYNWMQARHKVLSEQYERSFMIMAPKKG